MKSILKSLIIVFILLVNQYASAEEVTFTKGTYQEILDLAKAQNKIVMIDFVTDWCKWCVETDRKVYTNADVSAFANEHQINWKIDAEKGEGPALAKQYGVKGYPTIIFASADGAEIDRIYGYLPAEQFIVKMKDYNNGLNTYSSITKMLADNPDDAVANYLMAEKMTANGIEGDVKVYLEKVISVDPTNDRGYTDDAKFMLAYVKEDPVTIQSLINEYPNSEKVKDGYINLANYYSEKGDNAKAESIYSEAFAKFGKEDFDLKQSYGSMLIGIGYNVMKDEKATKQDRKDAIATLEKCLPYVNGTVNEASTYYIMSDLYFQNKNIDKANECIDMAIKIYDKKAYQEQKVKINKQEASTK